jgi:hypothetical protein
MDVGGHEARDRDVYQKVGREHVRQLPHQAHGRMLRRGVDVPAMGACVDGMEAVLSSEPRLSKQRWGAYGFTGGDPDTASVRAGRSQRSGRHGLQHGQTVGFIALVFSDDPRSRVG